MDLKRAIRHPVINQAWSGAPRHAHLQTAYPGLKVLRGVRTYYANRKRAQRNAAEEAGVAARIEAAHGPGAAYEAGYAMQAPRKPADEWKARKLREAIEAGLPDELRAICEALLAGE